MDFEVFRSLTAAFCEQSSRRQQDPFLWHKQDGRYRPQSWAEVARQVTELSRGLRSLGLQPGERVVLVAENRPEWLVADLAIIAAGGITVPAYTTALTSDHRHVLTDSGAVGTIVRSDEHTSELQSLMRISYAVFCLT